MKKLIISICTVLVLVAVLATPAIAAETQTAEASVTVGDVVSITISGGLDFGSITPPVTQQGVPGQVDLSPAITITVAPETNVEVHIGIKGAVTGGTLTLDNWFYSKLFDKSGIAALTTSYVEVYTTKVANDTCDFYHWITVPDGTAAGDHTVDVTYKVAKTGVAFE